MTVEELARYGLPLTFDEDMGHDFEEIAAEELAEIHQARKGVLSNIIHGRAWAHLQPMFFGESKP